jgi:small subunit ribosomal protein S20
MANHKSAVKRNRQTVKKREDNKYYAKSARNAVKKLRSTTEKTVAGEMLPKVNSILDKLAKKNIIHKKKASNLKSSLNKHVNSLS